MDGKITKGFKTIEEYFRWSKYIGLKESIAESRNIDYFVKAMNGYDYRSVDGNIRASR